jgi:peptidoglycan/xylan/chitin deacetylase (PgdA/CDA1 family)
MNFRTRTRAFAINAAALIRADTMLLGLRKLNPGSQALIVAMHETPLFLESHFRTQLEWASQYFRIGRLEDLAGLWTPNGNPEVASKPLLLFTFDDGRESNYTVAAPLLESFGGRGIFFVVPAFVESAGTPGALEFYRSRINPGCTAGVKASEDWKPMSPAQIAALATRGHAIGNHTSTHRKLVQLPVAELELEIGNSARQLASWTGKPVDAFAWTFGWDAIDKNAWEVARHYHRFCFSPCAGVVDSRHDQPSLLWRREIEVRYSPSEYRFGYSGLVDLWWAARRRRLRNMLAANCNGCGE